MHSGQRKIENFDIVKSIYTMYIGIQCAGVVIMETVFFSLSTPRLGTDALFVRVGKTCLFNLLICENSKLN